MNTHCLRAAVREGQRTVVDSLTQFWQKAEDKKKRVIISQTCSAASPSSTRPARQTSCPESAILVANPEGTQRHHHKRRLWSLPPRRRRGLLYQESRKTRCPSSPSSHQIRKKLSRFRSKRRCQRHRRKGHERRRRPPERWHRLVTTRRPSRLGVWFSSARGADGGEQS